MTLTQEEVQRRTSRPNYNEEQLKSNRFAMGLITGVYPGGGMYDEIFSVGPNGEKAWANQYTIFYRRGTYDFVGEPCHWTNDIPQGFSCAVGAEPNECESNFHGRYVPVECDKFVLKEAKKIMPFCKGDPDCLEGPVGF